MKYIIDLLYLLIALGVVFLILWVFERYISPIPSIVKGIVILIMILIALIWFLGNSGVIH
jgi:hypothetical protein